MKKVLSIMLIAVFLIQAAWTPTTSSAADSTLQNTVLSGKTISILGDSISTYKGVSDNTNMNKTIGKNPYYYSSTKLATQDLTYWGQVIKDNGMSLCVNNSAGGGKVAIDVDSTRLSAIKRSTELHNNDGQEPDIILVNIGTHDFVDTNMSLLKFTEGYKQMLNNMLEKYENAEVFCCTLIPRTSYSSTSTSSTTNSEKITREEHLIRMNNQIERIVAGYEDRVTLIDMYTESGITWNNLSDYCVYKSDGTTVNEHPNEAGMKKMAKVLERALLEVYELATFPSTPDVYFDLDFRDGKAISVGTNQDNTTIISNGKGEVTSLKVAHNGQVCDVPVYYAPKDATGTNQSYLDITFKNITEATNLISDEGVSFEYLIYVDEVPKATTGFMKQYQMLNAKKLTHVVETYDATRNVLSIYKDGDLISKAYNEGSINEFKLMASNDEYMDKYTAYAIADARVYMGALTEAQVAQQYNNCWEEVDYHAVSDNVHADKSQAIGDGLPAYIYGSVTGASYEGSTTGDRAVLNDADYTLHVFSNTSYSEYVSYLKALEDADWKQYSNNEIEGKNFFATYTKGEKSVYAYYIAGKASTYIVVSQTSYLESREQDNTYEALCEPLFTELRNISSSQCELVRLSDGRFIIIDGGNTETNHYQAKRIYEVLEKQNVLDKITVAAWIVTHPHSDHVNACTDFLEYYGSDDLEIEEIIYNYPNNADRLASNNQTKLENGEYTECNEPKVQAFLNSLERALLQWPNMRIVTCHTGQEYHIADATIEILHTIEDFFPTRVGELAHKVNDSSVAFKIKLAGQDIMFLGDSGATESGDLVDMWGDYLKSDFVQLSHHGMKGGTVELYEYIDPMVVSIPTTRGLMDPIVSENKDYIGKQEASVWVLANLGNNIKEVNVAGYGTRAFALPYTPNNDDYISNIKQNGYEMKEGDKTKTTVPEPYADLGFDGETLVDKGTADNTYEMVGGSVGENTVYYKGKPYQVTSYRAEKTSSDYNHIKLTMNDIGDADALKKLLIEDGHSLEMFFATDTAPEQIGGLMSNCNEGGVTLYARRMGVLCYQLGNTSRKDTYNSTNYASPSYFYTKNENNFAVGNTVTHVVATYDRAEGKLKLYQNGVLMCEGTYTDPDNYFKHSTAVDSLYNQMGIGINLASTSEALGKETGYTIIKSRIYDQPLTDEQVTSSYWSCIEDLTGDENIYDDWNPEQADGCKKVTVSYTKAEVESFLTEGKYPTRKGYLFGGWYTTTDIPEIDAKNYEATAAEAMKVVIRNVDDLQECETAYALFVPEDVLTVKAQVSANLIDKIDDNDSTGSIRFVTTVDSLVYKSVGFKVEYVNSKGDTKTINSVSKKVYEKLKAVDMSGAVVKELIYSPTLFCSISRYFKATTVTSLNQEKFGLEFSVTAFWETMDGSVVFGETVVKSINQYLETLK